jgi:hypothetical protein
MSRISALAVLLASAIGETALAQAPSGTLEKPGCDQTWRVLRYATLCFVSSQFCSTK